MPKKGKGGVTVKHHRANLELNKHKVNKHRKQLPVRCATQSEVTAKLKETQAADEQGVFQFLARRQDNPSASSRMPIHWGFGRDKIRKILKHLGTDGVLQSTMNNLMEAKRFEEAKDGQLRRSRCP